MSENSEEDKDNGLMLSQEEVGDRDMNDDRDLIREEEEDEEAVEAAEAAAAAAANAAGGRQRSGSARSDDTDQGAVRT